MPLDCLPSCTAVYSKSQNQSFSGNVSQEQPCVNKTLKILKTHKNLRQGNGPRSPRPRTTCLCSSRAENSGQGSSDEHTASLRPVLGPLLSTALPQVTWQQGRHTDLTGQCEDYRNKPPEALRRVLSKQQSSNVLAVSL